LLMDPRIFVSCLRRISTYISSNPVPDKYKVRSAVLQLLFATDRTLSLTVRDALLREIAKLVPGEFGGETYDTNPGGKGFRPGYVSFGLDPSTWEEAQIIGGILFRCTYNPAEFRSEEPDPKAQERAGWKGHSQGGGVVSLKIECGYYNKLVDGSYQSERKLGEARVLVDDQEQTIDVEIPDPATFASGIKDLIQEIKAEPPAIAQSAARKRQLQAPTTSPTALLTWLVKTNQDSVGRSEIEALVRAMAGRTDRTYSNVLEEVTAFFRKRHWPIDPNK
jgi:hypothetical protein